MQVRFANRDEFAWDMGEKSYEPGDNLATGVAKAAQQGLRPGCNGYSAFITAFSRRMRQYRDAGVSINAAQVSAGSGLQVQVPAQVQGEGMQASG